MFQSVHIIGDKGIIVVTENNIAFKFKKIIIMVGHDEDKLIINGRLGLQKC